MNKNFSRKEKKILKSKIANTAAVIRDELSIPSHRPTDTIGIAKQVKEIRNLFMGHCAGKILIVYEEDLKDHPNDERTSEILFRILEFLLTVNID